MSHEWQEYMQAENARHIADLKEQLATERAKVALAVDALKGLLIMTDRGPCPRKLDDALTWRANDDLARSKALAAIKTGEKSTDALADIRREVARECAEEADNFAKSQHWGSDGERASMKIADAIRAKFGVTE